MKINKIDIDKLRDMKDIFSLSYGENIDINDEIDYFNEENPDNWYLATDDNLNNIGYIRAFYTMDRNILKVELYTLDNDVDIEKKLIKTFNSSLENKKGLTYRFSLSEDKLYLKSYLENIGFINDKNFLRFEYNENVDIRNTDCVRFAKNNDQEIQDIICILKHFQLLNVEQILKYINNDNLIVYENNNEIIGVSLNTIEDNKLEIIEIAIKENFRGRGFGKIFLNDMIHFYKSKDKRIVFYLKVEEKNTNAVNLYKSVNFNEITEEKEFWLSKRY